MKTCDSTPEYIPSRRLCQIALTACTTTLMCTALTGFFWPISAGITDSQARITCHGNGNNNLLTSLAKDGDQQKLLTHFYRAGLFKGAMRVNDKPLADKTIERIREQLTLQCIINMKGQPVAYIKIKGLGLRRCRVGDSVKGLFTVLNIDDINKNTEISIVDHKVTLQL